MLPALAKTLMSKKGLLFGTGLLGGGYLAGRSLSGKSSEDIQLNDQLQQHSQLQPTEPTKQTQSRKAVANSITSQTQQTQTTRQDTPTVGAFLPELLKLYQLSNTLALQYEEEAKAYYQVFQEYSERLDKLLQYLSMSLAKTPLGMMSSFDLPDIIENLMKYYPWDYAKEVFPKVLTGYYILKANGHEDLSRYTIEDLITAAENPALAEALGQNVYNTLLNYAENYKLVMQSALDQIGKLKDFYTYRLNLLNAQANLIKGIIDAILKEEKLNFEKWLKTWDMMIKELKARADISHKFAKLNLEREKFEWKKQQDLQSQIPLQIKIEEKRK
jgi:hypothetical protein